MKFRRLLIVFTALFAFLSSFLVHALNNSEAKKLPELKVAVIASGTVNWELQHIKNQQLDHRNGFKLVIRPVASLGAARLALTSGTADAVVSDWLWAAKRAEQGQPLSFIPFSSQIGSAISADKTISSVKDLKGKRIGIAGGPLNKAWVLLQAKAAQSGIDLRKDAQIQFAAPPLLSQALKKGQIDLLVTFWHYGVKLKAEGYSERFSLNQVMREMGLATDVPMLGYLFDRQFSDQNPQLVMQFAKTITQAKQQLNQDDRYWQPLIPLMRSSNKAVISGLIAGYRAGIPDQIDQAQISDAQAFYGLIAKTAHRKSAESIGTLDPALFWSATK